MLKPETDATLSLGLTVPEYLALRGQGYRQGYHQK